MKAKLLKKVRKRYTLYYDPNTSYRKYCFKYKAKIDWSGFPLFLPTRHMESFKSHNKELLFLEYRKSIVKNCGSDYGQFKRTQRKPHVIIKHAEK